MKRFFVLILIIAVSFNICPQDKMEKVNTIIKEVKEKFAPDKRVAIFNIEATESENDFTIKGETNLAEAKSELVQMFNDINIVFMDQIDLLPSQELGENTFGVINLSVANFRAKTEHSAELVTQAILGTPINILKKGEDGFYLVQTPDGYISWLDNDGFTFMNETEFRSWQISDKIIYLNDYGFSFSEADINSQRVSDLVAGNVLKLIDEEGNFYKINYPDGREAYIKKDEAKLFRDWYDSLYPTGETILNTAYKFIGIPYLWGGTSTKGMDCSGFTKTIYFLNGIVLKRDASQQVNTGELIDIKDGWKYLQAGDLLFFGRRASDNRKERITHVAIYIGDGDFIHAAGKVRINSFNKSKTYYSKYRDNAFIRAKRILSSVGKNGIEKIMGNSFYK